MIHAVKSGIKGPVLDQLPLRLAKPIIYILVSRALIPHLQYSHHEDANWNFLQRRLRFRRSRSLFDAFSDVSYGLAGQDQRHKLQEWPL